MKWFSASITFLTILESHLNLSCFQPPRGAVRVWYSMNSYHDTEVKNTFTEVDISGGAAHCAISLIINLWHGIWTYGGIDG